MRKKRVPSEQGAFEGRVESRRGRRRSGFFAVRAACRRRKQRSEKFGPRQRDAMAANMYRVGGNCVRVRAGDCARRWHFS